MYDSPLALLRFLSILPLLLFAAAIAHAGTVLQSIHDVRALSPEKAAQNLPASIDVTVTFCDPTQRDLLVHDGHEGMFVLLPNDMHTRPFIGPGSRLHIEGITQPGGFLPIVECHRYTVLGAGSLPPPLHMEQAELFSPAMDCQWVEVPAVVTGIESGSWYFTLAAEVSGWTLKLQLPNDPRSTERAAAILQRPVKIRGVVGTVYNEERQLTDRYLFVPSFEQIVPVEGMAPEAPPQLRAVNELLRSDATVQTRVRVRGTVTHAADNALYLRGEGGSLLVHTAGTAGLAPGVQIEAEGFASVAPFRPMLRATRVTVLGRCPPPAPETLDLNSDKIVSQQAELVTVDADLLGTKKGPADQMILQCRTGIWLFEAPLPRGVSLPGGMGANDRIRITGICELTTTRPLPRTNWVDGFRLHPRSSEDLAILRHAPWWTLPRLLWALGVLGIIAVGSMSWGAVLRRRVHEQTEIIRAQIEREAAKDERQRIARELHDTIEQELAGLSVQLRNARQRLADSPDRAGTALDLAQRMLRHCRQEARTSIRDLRSVALEMRGLDGALEELTGPVATECGAQFRLEVSGKLQHLPGTTAIHLLRIAHEAVANAARHASPRNIEVRLEYAADSVSLEVRDDGCGFDPTAAAPRGHFGLLGIQERAGKLNAALHLASAPSQGTTLRIKAPLAATAAPQN